MEIILLQDLDELGLEGDIVKVANGYARNYLIPRGIAFEATPQNVKSLEQRRKKIELRKLKAKEEAEQLKEKMSEVLVQLSQKAGEEGKLYGSVTSMDIAAELEKQGIVVDRRKIMLDKPIKVLGEFEVPIRIYPEVIGSIKVVVSPKEEGE
ncbi:MAG: 50S ribosomal protein L9 [Deltaproteobacteria bacterium]|nr:50S ribosomal protein L9 [Deltaproteobacteria bacterium]